MTRAAHFPRRRYPTEGFDSIRSRPSVRPSVRPSSPRRPRRPRPVPSRSLDGSSRRITDRPIADAPTARRSRAAPRVVVHRPPSTVVGVHPRGGWRPPPTPTSPRPLDPLDPLDRSRRRSRTSSQHARRSRIRSRPLDRGERSRESSRARSRQSINVFMRRVIVEYVYTSRSGDVIRRDVHHARPSAGRRAGLKFGDARTGGWMDGWMDG